MTLSTFSWAVIAVTVPVLLIQLVVEIVTR